MTTSGRVRSCVARTAILVTGLLPAVGLIAPGASAATPTITRTTSPSASTGSSCAVQLSVSSPRAGSLQTPGTVEIMGTASDPGSPNSGPPIIAASLGDRDSGGRGLTGNGAFSGNTFTLSTRIPTGVSDGQDLFVYATSQASGLESSIDLPIFVQTPRTTIGTAAFTDATVNCAVVPAAPLSASTGPSTAPPGPGQPLLSVPTTPSSPGTGTGPGGSGGGTPRATIGNWQAGPDGTGTDTYDGLVEQPPAGGAVTEGADLKVSGWAVDLTAQGWSGIDQVQVLGGALPTGTVLATGTVGLARPDVASSLGNAAGANAGFVVTVPGSAVTATLNTLYVYVHTPGKGWWYATQTVAPAAATSSNSGPFGAAAGDGSGTADPSDPQLGVDTPLASNMFSVNAAKAGRLATGLQAITGWALDRNALANGVNTVGVDRVSAYLKAPRGQEGSISLGDATLGKKTTDSVPLSFGASYQSSGFTLGTLGGEIASLSVGTYPLYVYARSAYSGKETVDQITLDVTS